MIDVLHDRPFQATLPSPQRMLAVACGTGDLIRAYVFQGNARHRNLLVHGASMAVSLQVLFIWRALDTTSSVAKPELSFVYQYSHDRLAGIDPSTG